MQRADGVRVAHPLFQEGGSGSTPTSALQLTFFGCSRKTAICLNALWHSRLPRVSDSNILRNRHHACFVAEFDGRYFASAIWSSPCAMGLPHTWLELRRLAVAPDAPRNTATRMLGWMARKIRQSIPEIDRLISYQDCDVHTGGIYRGAGWVPTVKSFDHRDRGKRAGRKRNDSQTMATKQRWEKVIRP